MLLQVISFRQTGKKVSYAQNTGPKASDRL